MKVLYDYQVFSWQVYGGISRYFVELFKQWNLQDGISFELALKLSNNVYLQEEFENRSNGFLAESNFRGKARLMNKINRFQAKKAVAKNNFDIFHPTYYNDYFLKDLKKPFVLTIHDMTNERLKHIYPVLDDKWLIEKKKRLALKSNKIITISNHAKRDILELYPEIAEEKVEVVYHGFPDLGKPSFKALEVPEKFLLFVGSRKFYKNFSFFIQTVSSLLKEEPEMYVVLAGGGPLTKEEQEELRNTGIFNKVRHIAFSTNGELSWLYSQSLAFVFPSLYEGFGLPVLEAFSCRTAVVVSNNTALAEVGGDAVLSFDPTDEKDLLEKLRLVLQQDVRDKMVTKGTERLKYFGWAKASEQTLAVYESVLKAPY